jgi:hypothetical protein
MCCCARRGCEGRDRPQLCSPVHGLVLTVKLCGILVSGALQGDSTIVLDAMMFRRGMASRELYLQYHKASQLLMCFQHVDFQYIARSGGGVSQLGWHCCSTSAGILTWHRTEALRCHMSLRAAGSVVMMSLEHTRRVRRHIRMLRWSSHTQVAVSKLAAADWNVLAALLKYH